jgi:HD-like signal output (HDOD) protein
MPEQEAVTALKGRLIRGLDQLPPFSPVLNKLLATMAAEDVSFAQVATLIESDTVLAGNVLKVVNSALYGFRGTVNSVRHAVAILGVDRLRNLSLGFSFARMWTHMPTPEGWSGSKFNQHSLAVGILADLLAQRAAAPYPEGAFVAGLLHDIGKLLIATSLPVCTRSRATPTRPASAPRRGSRVGGTWGTPSARARRSIPTSTSSSARTCWAAAAGPPGRVYRTRLPAAPTPCRFR